MGSPVAASVSRGTDMAGVPATLNAAVKGERWKSCLSQPRPSAPSAPLGVRAQGDGQFAQGRGEQQVVVGEVLADRACDAVAHRERVDELGSAGLLPVCVTGQHLGFDRGGVDGSLEGGGEAVDPRHQVGAPQAGIEVVEALARALHLDSSEREHLTDLLLPAPHTVRRAPSQPQRVRPGPYLTLETLRDVPA